MMRLRRTLATAGCVLAMAGYAVHSHAQEEWPKRPIRVIVPAAPGGAGDITARALAPALGEQLGQRIVIDNRAGAAGNIGVELAAKAQPDGYTILLGNISTNAVNPTTFASVLKFDIAAELTGVTMVARIPNVLVSGVAFPPNNLAELIDYTKARPGQLNYSNPVGGISHLDMIEFMAKAGISMVNVPSKGGGSSAAPIMAGEIHCSMISAVTVVPQIKAGRMKGFVTTAQRRLAELPETPTMAEAGFAGIGSEFWVAFFVPSKTPPAVVTRIHAAVARIAQQPQVKETFEKAGIPMVVSASPAEFQRYVAAEIKRYARIIKDNNVRFR